MPTRPSQESNLGLQQTRLVLYQLIYQDQAETQPERVTSHSSYIYIYMKIVEKHETLSSNLRLWSPSSLVVNNL